VVLLALGIAVASFLLVDRAFRGRVVAQPGETPSPTISAVGPAANGLIAFGCSYHICTMAPDGSGITDLIEPYDRSVVLTAGGPVWPPDGTKIAFTGYNERGSHPAGGGANYDVYVMNADGSGVTDLTTSQQDVRSGNSQTSPSWSPDGTQIVFNNYSRDPASSGIYMMNADGSAQTKIADVGYSASPWSPDGSRILFSMNGHGGADLYTVHPDGSGLTQLTSSPDGVYDEFPSWSPDGSKIAFLRGARSIYVMNADGTDQLAVFDRAGSRLLRPVWSPDGTKLAFDVYDDGTWDIYEVSADGAGLKDLTPTSDRDENGPTWSPDGTRIAFAATHMLSTGVDNTGSFDIYLMNPDGTGEERLTKDAGHDPNLSWQAVFTALLSPSPTSP
ncbi:MAG: hypothetical protein M3P43_18500, partial [Actinomycetota bacterium]|nr:hypothetical protein [Actinomycetota bacterium]